MQSMSTINPLISTVSTISLFSNNLRMIKAYIAYLETRLPSHTSLMLVSMAFHGHDKRQCRIFLTTNHRPDSFGMFFLPSFGSAVPW